MDVSIVAFVLLLALAFANGANDVSKAIATLVGSGVTGVSHGHSLGDSMDGPWCCSFRSDRHGHGQDLQSRIAGTWRLCFAQSRCGRARWRHALGPRRFADRTARFDHSCADWGHRRGGPPRIWKRGTALGGDWKENCSAAHSEPSLGVGALSRAASTHAKAGGSLGRNLPVCDADGSGAGYDRWTGGDADAFFKLRLWGDR
jgi:hypothetical protein